MNRDDVSSLRALARDRPDPEAPDDLSTPRSWHMKGGMNIMMLFLLFYLSGLASLICETVWFKQLQFVLGSSTFAMSVVVACFFGGLSFGGWIGGRLADGSRDLLKLYALLEFSLSLSSAALTLALSLWEGWVALLAPWLGPQSGVSWPLTVLVSAAVLIVPTALMGATLPVLGKYLTSRGSGLARRIGLLYGVNTLGGATGCALGGFFLIGYLGVIQSALVASGIYSGIALAAVVVNRSSPRIQEVADGPATGRGPAIEAPPARSGGWLMVAFALMGFTAIAYEVLWFRLLIYYGVHTVYAFASMLSTYLIGLVMGSLITARYLSRRGDQQVADLARVQLLIVATALIALAMIGRSNNILRAVFGLEQRLGVPGALADLFAGTSSFIILCLLVLLLPSTLIGIGLPLAMELVACRRTELGTRLGMLYCVNTLGGVLGSLLVGFVLLPLLGSQGAYTTILILNLALIAVLALADPAVRGDRRLLREAGMTAVLIIAGCLTLGRDYLKKSLTNFQGADVLAFRESPDATFVVAGYDSPSAGRFQQLVVNGTSYANNSPPGRRYMGLLGHLPTLLHPDPDSALVISIGTGTTAGALTLHTRLVRIWAVDIASDVFDLAPLFVPLNHSFTESPRVYQVVADGRHFLLGTDLRFDVLTFEPPPPIEAGVVNLYSREFYRLAKLRMNRGAVLCQWIPLDNMFELQSRMLIRTMMDEFPHVSLWIPSRMEAVIIASDDPLHIDSDRLRERMSAPALHDDLTAYGLGEPDQLLATFVTADRGLSDYVAGAPAVTDNQPRIEYFNLYWPKRAIRFADILSHRQPVERYLIRPLSDTTRLRASQGVMQKIWEQYEHERFGRLDAADACVEEALRLDPQNAYLHYLQAEASEHQRARRSTFSQGNAAFHGPGR